MGLEQRVAALDAVAASPCRRGVHARVRHMPAGWEIVRTRERGPGERVILCARTDDNRVDTDYVTWRTEGEGCYLGHYTNDARRALADHATR